MNTKNKKNNKIKDAPRNASKTAFRYATDVILSPDVWIMHEWYFSKKKEENEIKDMVEKYIKYYSTEKEKREGGRPDKFGDIGADMLENCKEEEIATGREFHLVFKYQGEEKDVPIIEKEVIVEKRNGAI